VAGVIRLDVTPKGRFEGVALARHQHLRSCSYVTVPRNPNPSSQMLYVETLGLLSFVWAALWLEIQSIAVRTSVRAVSGKVGCRALATVASHRLDRHCAPVYK